MSPLVRNPPPGQVDEATCRWTAVNQIPVINPEYVAYVVRTAFSPMTPPDAASMRAATLCLAASAYHLRQAGQANILPARDSDEGVELVDTVNDSMIDLIWAWCRGYPDVGQPVWDLSEEIAAGLEGLAATVSTMRDAEMRTALSRQGDQRETTPPALSDPPATPEMSPAAPNRRGSTQSDDPDKAAGPAFNHPGPQMAQLVSTRR